MLPSAAVLHAWKQLPVVDAGALFADGPILILAPHPDDEALGCGGLIAECCATGREVHIAVLTDGAASHPRSRLWPPERLAALRADEARAASAALGVPEANVRFLNYSDGRAPQGGAGLREAVERVAAHVQEVGAAVICTTCNYDPSPDHKAAHRIAAMAAEQTGAKLVLYPIWSLALPARAWLPAAPIRGGRLDIARHLPAKRRAIACHRSQTTDLIADDPTGFRLAPEILALFDQAFEIFLEPVQPTAVR